MQTFLKATLAAGALALTSFSSLALAADGSVKIGAVLSLTGGAGTLGDPALKTLQMYVEGINKSGGLLGRQLELVTYDDGSEPAKANGFAKRLIEDDHVDVFIGGSTTGSTMAMYPLVEKAEMPFVSLGGALVIVDPVKKWMFKVSHNDRQIAEKVLIDMKARGLTSIGLISETSGYGQSGRKETLALAPKYGIEIAADETYGNKDTDVTAQLTKIKANAKVQAIFVFGFGQGSVVVTKNMAQLGIKLPHYEATGSASQEYIQLTGAAAEGARLPSPAMLVGAQLKDGDPQKAISIEYVKSYQERYKTDASTFGGYARDAFFLWVDAVKRAGSFDKTKVRDALESTKGLTGTCGIVNMTAADHLGLDLTAFKMIEVKAGAWTLAE
jgi:branched-chain amino acid transport system substrate-binding protein